MVYSNRQCRTYLQWSIGRGALGNTVAAGFISARSRQCSVLSAHHAMPLAWCCCSWPLLHHLLNLWNLCGNCGSLWLTVSKPLRNDASSTDPKSGTDLHHIPSDVPTVCRYNRDIFNLQMACLIWTAYKMSNESKTLWNQRNVFHSMWVFSSPELSTDSRHTSQTRLWRRLRMRLE
jgi:hypothetical protein